MQQTVLSAEQLDSLKRISADKETPFLLFNLGMMVDKYRELETSFPYASIYYAVKANPESAILERLRDLGSCFDIASVYELDKVMALGITADRLSFGNTIKNAQSIRYAYEKGVRMFASDCESDIRNLAVCAPGSQVFLRILTEGSETADWPLSKKFGCQSDMAVDLMVLAKNLGLDPYGISFHVGSQQRDIGAWDAALAKVKFISDRLKTHGITLRMINIGGGLPASYNSIAHDLPTYGQAIKRFIDEDFGDQQPRIIIEPGRALVAEAGVLVTEIVMVARKSRDALLRWVYLDTGLFNGMIETLGEAIKYPLILDRESEAMEEVIFAGPTCDSLDIMYEDHRYNLPLDTRAGDRLYWLSTGAYTTSYCSVEFNGFPPLKSFVVESF